MKARLTLVYEVDVRPGEESETKEILDESVEEGDEQLLFEEFGIGWNVPVVRKVEYESDHKPSGCLVDGKWVRDGGNDAAGNGSWEKPFATIAGAVEAVIKREGEAHADQA